MRRSVVRASIAVVAVAALVGAGALVAHGTLLGSAGGVRYKAQGGLLDRTSHSVQWDRVRAACRHGDLPAGGGPRVAGPPRRTFILDSYPNGDLWQSLVFQPKALRDSRWSVRVVCPKHVYTQSFLNVGPLTIGVHSGTNECHSDWHVVGGGVIQRGSHGGSGPDHIQPGDAYLNSSYPVDLLDADSKPDDGWRIVVNVLDAGPASNLDVVASCDRGPAPAYRQRSRTAPSGTSVRVTAPCRPRQHVLGGGAFVGGASSEAQIASSYPVDKGDRDKVPDDAWRVVVANRTGADKSVLVRAICKG